MKKLKAIIVIMFIGLFGTAQTVGGVHISEIDAEYVELVGTAKLLKPYQVTITVDYGQYGTMKEARDGGGGKLIDFQGYPAIVNGMMGAVNLFAKNGWELHSTMLLTVGNSSVYHYILKKKSKGNSSAINKSNSDDNFRDAELDAPLKESNTQATITEQKPKSETKYKVGQIVYFYKNDELIESKIIFIDTIGEICNAGCLKVEYTDVLKDKTKTKYIAFDKVLLEKP